MGQKANPKRIKDNEAMAYGKYLKVSWRKLNLLAQMIRGKKAGRAMTDLEFSRKRIAQDVRKVLQSAISNAENNHGLNVDRLVITGATVGKTLKMRRFHARGRGKAASVEKKFANIRITVGEQEEKVKAPKPKKAEGQPKAAKPVAKKKSEKPAKASKGEQ